MRAVAVEKFKGEPRLMDLPDPKPKEDQLLVKVGAAGINPFDWKIVDGALDGVMPHVFPLILGNDAAGVVAGLGAKSLAFVKAIVSLDNSCTRRSARGPMPNLRWCPSRAPSQKFRPGSPMKPRRRSPRPA